MVADGNGETGERNGNIAALFPESVFHSNRSIENDGLSTVETCVELGDDSHGEVENVLDERIVEVASNELSKTGEEELKIIIQKHKAVIRFRHGSCWPAKISPVKIRLDKT